MPEIPSTFVSGLVYGFGFWIAAVVVILIFKSVGITAF